MLDEELIGLRLAEEVSEKARSRTVGGIAGGENSGQLDQRVVAEEEASGAGVLDGGAEVFGGIDDEGGEEAGVAGLGGRIAGDAGGGADGAVGEVVLIVAGR